MKVLIQNYTTNSTTEPLYISECVNSVDGCEAAVWNKNVSAYDMFDIVEPDLFITHLSLLTPDIIKYLSQNKSISAIFNVTMVEQMHVDQLDSMVSENKIQCPFFFTNQPKILNRLRQKNIKLVSIMHGADIFLSQQQPVGFDYDIELGIVSNYEVGDRFKDLVDNFNSYHYLTQNTKLTEGFDISIPVMQMYSLWNKYRKIVITMDDMYLPQSFFDAIVYGNDVFYHPKYGSMKGKMNSNLQSMLGISQSLSCSFEQIVSGQDHSDVKKKILDRHTCAHRVKRMFSQLNCSEIERGLSNMISRIKEQ